jgi:hypothetical protein
MNFETLKAITETIESLKEYCFGDFDSVVECFEKRGTINDLDNENGEWVDISYSERNDLPICVDCSFVKKASGNYEVADSFSVFNTETGEKLLDID